jgi:hypothetical protein
MPVLIYAFCFALAAVGLGCLSLFGWVLWPGRARAAREVIEVSRGRCLVVGLLHGVALIFMMGVAGRRGGGAGLLAALLLLWVVWQLLAALPGVLSWVGESIGSLADRPQLDTARATVWGACVLAGMALIPWLGWALGIASLAAVCGAGFLSRGPAKGPS